METINNEGELPVQCFEITTNYLYPTAASNIFHRPSLLERSFPNLIQNSEVQGRNSLMYPNTRMSVNQFPLHNGMVLAPQQERTVTIGYPRNAPSTRQAALTVGIIFIVSTVALAYIYLNFPELEDEERKHMKLPWDIEDAKKLGRVLDRYKQKYYFEVLSAVFVSYLFLQTFAIPGSISLSILSGFLFPFYLALALVCFCSATGASLCYVLSYYLGRGLIYKYFPEKASQWAAKVNSHRDNLFNYLLFLRITPFLPNWFINIVSPVIDVPLFPFWLGTFLGVAPPSFVAIQTGQTLYELSASSATWSWTSVILLGVFAVFSLIPVLLKEYLKEKFD